MRRAWFLSAIVTLGVLSPPAHASVWPNGHRRILVGLASSDVAERRSAAGRLLELPSKSVAEHARSALRDPDVEVRLHAARAASVLGLERAGDDVVSWLQEPEVRVRAAACEVIRSAPTSESVAALGRVLSDGKSEIREQAAQAMGASGYADAVSPLIGHLDDTVTAVRVAVVRALGRLGDVRAAVPIVSKLQDAEAEVRSEAARALGLLRDRQALPSLEVTLGDKEIAVRLAALDALGRIGAPSSVTAIAALLAPDTADVNGVTVSQAGHAVREAALRSLARIRVPAALAALIGELEREGPIPYQDEAVAPVRRALKLSGDAAVVPLMAVLENSASRREVSAAALALAALATPGSSRASVVATVGAARRGVADLVAALKALERLEHPAALPFILEHLDDADPGTRELVVAVAARLVKPSVPDGRVVDVVEPRVADLAAPIAERVGLVRLLGRTGTKRAASLLVSLLPVSRSTEAVHAADSVSLRVAVMDALGDNGVHDAAVEALLLGALDHASERVRVAGARALARVGRDSAANVLLMRLGAAAEQDRAAIGTAVSGALAHATEPALVARASAALAVSSGRSRDALLEGLGRSSAQGSAAVLDAFSRSADPDDRRKVAEALAGRADAAPILERLVKDRDAGVRANAIWSLGFANDEAARVKARLAVADEDVAVAGNAAISVARLALRLGRATEVATLCGALDDPRSYVVFESLVGLRMLTAHAPATAVNVPLSCAKGVVRRLLGTARSPRVRAASAALLFEGLRRERPADAPSVDEARLDRLALTRCTLDDRASVVARVCGDAEAPPLPSHGANPLTIYVVPEGRVEPTAGAAFALALPDGTLRLGNADRRGAVFERHAADGTVELAVPAALAP